MSFRSLLDYMSEERLACLIAGRNLGDIVIVSGVVRQLIGSGYAERYLVWTRPQMEFMFRGLPNCEVICSPFPVGTRKGFDARGLAAWLRAIRRIRSRRPSVSLDFVGDFRERMFGRLIGSARHLHIGWGRDHPYRNLIRNPLGQGCPFIRVPAQIANAYEGYQLMVGELTHKHPAGATAWEPDDLRPRRRDAKSWRVGLHPFASQACKLWPTERWVNLTRELLADGCTVIVFSAPAERDHLESIFAKVREEVTMVTGDIEEFFAAVSRLDLMIGLDSFSVHLAQRAGVRSIMINAGSPPELWRVPSGITLAASGGCRRYPCYNVAPCRGTNYENACVRAITESDVLAAVGKLKREDFEGNGPGRP